MYRAKNKPSRLALRILRAPYFYPTGDATRRGIRPMVRRWCIRPRLANGVRGRVVLRHRTPEPCLKKSCGQAVFSAPGMSMHLHLECKASDLFRKVLFIKMLRSQSLADHPRILRTSQKET
jgi:hypothetical protein